VPPIATEDEVLAFQAAPEIFWSYAPIRGWIMFLPGLPDRAFRLYCKLRSFIAHDSPRTLRRMTVDQICWLMTNPGEKPVSESTAKNMLRSLREHGLIEDMDGDNREYSGARRYRIKELPSAEHLGVRNAWDFLDCYAKDWRAGGQNSDPLTNPDNPHGVKTDITTPVTPRGGQNSDPRGQDSDRGGQNSIGDKPLTCENSSLYKALSSKLVQKSSSSSSSPSVRNRGTGYDATAPREDEEDEMQTNTSPARPLDGLDQADMEAIEAAIDSGAEGEIDPVTGLPMHLARTGEAYFTGAVPLPDEQHRPVKLEKPVEAVRVPRTGSLPAQTRRQITKTPQKPLNAPVAPSQAEDDPAERLGALWERERAVYGFATTRSVRSKVVTQTRAQLANGEREVLLAAALRAMAVQRRWLCLDKHMENYVPSVTGDLAGLSSDQMRAVAQLRGLATENGSVNWQRLAEWRADNIGLLSACGWVGDDWDEGLKTAGIVWVKGRGNVLMDTQ
jgi:hypothetical protein